MKIRNKKGDAGVSSIMGVFILLTIFGGVMEYEGKWGTDGKYAIKDCVDTHTNGNCAHLPLNDFELAGNDFTNFAGE